MNSTHLASRALVMRE